MVHSAQTRPEEVQQSEPPIKPTLQAALHTATRSKHADLNRLITHRLPLCLPPHATTPLPYHLGMLAFASIYQHFEEAIDEIRQEQTKDAPSNQDRHRHIEVVEKLYTGGLPRSQQLRRDAQTMHERLSHTHQFSKHSVGSLESIESSIQMQAQAKTSHIHQRIQDKPYLSLAYTWAMYLALFNGGRWLLKQLESAGQDFWLETQEQTSPQQSITTLSFWHFDAATLEDPHADQLKLSFKNNFDLASSMLTESESAKVVEEGMAVFDTCSQLVEELDTYISNIERPSTSSKLQTDSISKGNDDSASPIWQTLESIVLAPAYQMMRRIWTQSSRSDVSIAAS